MTKPLLRPPRQWPGAPFCDVWGPTTQLFTGQSLLKDRCGFFFFFKTRLWGNLKAQDLKGIQTKQGSGRWRTHLLWIK